jgi:hypothetical protein
MTAQELKQLKTDYKDISAVLEIITKICADFETPEWNAHQREFQTRACLKKMKKEYGEKLIGTML